MKVLYLIDTLEGYGAEKSIVQIALHMKEVTPVFVHLYQGNKLKPSLEEAGIKVYSLNINSAYGYKEALKFLQPIIEKEKPDILHSSLYRADRVARKIKNLFPGIILIGSFVSNSYGRKRYSQLSILSKIKLLKTQVIDRLTARKVDFFISNSNTIQKTNTRALNIPSNKIKVIYRGRCFEDFNASRNNTSIIQEDLNLYNKTVFLNVGRLIKSKGQLDLLAAFKSYLEYDPSSILLIAGEGPLRKTLAVRIKHIGLENNVRLLGYREDIPDLLNISDFFVFPSYFEGLPGALIEAIISKTPCIVSDISENRECFQKDGAIFFTPGDVKALFDSIKKADELKDWKTKVTKSFEFAECNFEINKISKEYENFYNSLVIKKKS